MYNCPECVLLKYLTILYWSSSMVARLECLSNIDTLKPSVFATWSCITGCSCLWSPIKTTCFAPEHVIGTSDSGSMHMPHSSTMHCWMLSQEETILGLPEAAQVQRMIWTPDSWRAHFSASPMTLRERNLKSHHLYQVIKVFGIWQEKLGADLLFFFCGRFSVDLNVKISFRFVKKTLTDF